MKKILVSFLLMLVAFSLYSQNSDGKETEKKEIKSEGVIFNDGKTNYAPYGVQFKIEATDEEAGIKAIYYLTDKDSAFKLYSDAFGGFNTEGLHYIAYKIEDNVGNVSPLKLYEFVLDMSAPETKITSEKKPVKVGNRNYFGPDAKFTLSAFDKLSGVKAIEFGLDTDQLAEYSAEITLAADAQAGEHKISYKATDNVGNIADAKTYSFFLDNIAPKVEFTIDPVAFEKESAKYIASSSIIKISAMDEESGLDKILVSIDNAEFVEYTTAITKLAAGEHTIKAKAIDLVGNTSEEIVLTVIIDEKTPEGDLKPSEELKR